MSKRSPGKQITNGEAASERKEVAARAPEPAAVLTPAPTAFKTPLGLMRADTREKQLYKIACGGTPLGSDFFDDFKDVQEILTLSLSISVRLLIVAICNSELAPTQRISAMRLVAALNGKQLPADEDQPGAKAPMPGPTVDASSAMRSIAKIRELTNLEQ